MLLYMYLAAVVVHLLSARAATVTYNWNITWVTANPDS